MAADAMRNDQAGKDCSDKDQTCLLAAWLDPAAQHDAFSGAISSSSASVTQVVCTLHAIRPWACLIWAQQLDSADFTTEEPPQEDEEANTEEEEADYRANDSVCIQCDDGGTLMTVWGAQQYSC